MGHKLGLFKALGTIEYIHQKRILTIGNINKMKPTNPNANAFEKLHMSK